LRNKADRATIVTKRWLDVLISALRTMFKYFQKMSESTTTPVVCGFFRSINDIVLEDTIEMALEKIKEETPNLKKYKVKIKGPNATRPPSWKEISFDLTLIESFIRNMAPQLLIG
jgi:hypothetical protein